MANTVYDNVVLGNKINTILDTKLALQNLFTVDTSMTETAGMTKQVNVYTPSGDVEDLEIGKGNTKEIAVSFAPKTYNVLTTQGKFQYFDEQAMNDPTAIEAGLNGLAEEMVNNFTAKAIAALGTASLTFDASTAGLTFDNIVDAIAAMNREDDNDLQLLINVADKAKLRKALGDDLKYVEDFVRTGYIGSVAGVPVYVSKAVPKNTAYLFTKDAVTLFIKKDTEIEQERDADKRNNMVYARRYTVVALTDATKAVKITTGANA